MSARDSIIGLWDRAGVDIEALLAQHEAETTAAVPLCDDCGHVEAAHKEPTDDADEGGCDASGARINQCTCVYFIPREVAW